MGKAEVYNPVDILAPEDDHKPQNKAINVSVSPTVYRFADCEPSHPKTHHMSYTC